MAEGMEEQAAEVLSQQFNIYAMIFFICSRFIATFLMKWLKPAVLLSIFGILAMFFTLGVIVFQNRMGIYCLVCVSGCMSLMFPTIYAIALKGLGDDAKFGAAGLIMAILGGSVLPPLQAMIIDKGTLFGDFPATNVSFVLPFVCFLIVTVYGYRVHVRKNKE
jgi:FHS family L-fucose permease-like MFS transporter